MIPKKLDWNAAWTLGLLIVGLAGGAYKLHVDTVGELKRINEKVDAKIEKHADLAGHPPLVAAIENINKTLESQNADLNRNIAAQKEAILVLLELKIKNLEGSIRQDFIRLQARVDHMCDTLDEMRKAGK